VAIIAWGSLIWCPRNLAIRSKWHPDGPCLPVEFARKSAGMRVTLVLVPGCQRSRTYWAVSSFDSINGAAENLKEREGSPDLKPIHAADPQLGARSLGEGKSPDREVSDAVLEWLNTHDVDAAVWTGLGPKAFNLTGSNPLTDQVVAFLRSLDHTAERYAREYVEFAPATINTPVRSAIEQGLGWKRRDLPESLFETGAPVEER